MRSRLTGAALVVAGAVAAFVSGAVAPAATASSVEYFLFSGEGNRLNVYDMTDLDADAFPKQTLIKSGTEGEKDFNAQICFDPTSPNHFIGGEDTNQPDPPAGWGYFELSGRAIGEFGWEQQGRFVPTYQPTQVSNPENYGCWFRENHTMFTTDIGDQYPGLPESGQLILWFPPFDRYEIAYCKIAIDIPTSGGIWVDDQDRVYLPSNRPGLDVLNNTTGAVYRYSGDWPTGPDADGGCGQTDGTGAPMVDDGRITRETFITFDDTLLTPSAIYPSKHDTLYVSSVFSGAIVEYEMDGTPIRTIMQPPLGELPPYPSTGTPYGIVVDDRDVLYYADLGVDAGPPPGPVDGIGTVRMIRFDENGDPLPPQIIDEGLDFPDGVGMRTFLTSEPAPDTGVEATDDELATTGGGAAALGLLGLGVWFAIRRRK